MSLDQTLLLLIPLLPLAAGLVCLLFASRLQARAAGALGALSLLASGVLCGLLIKVGGASLSIPWINLPDAFMAESVVMGGEGGALGYNLPFALKLGSMQLLFAISCALIACGVLVYALREREGDPQAARFHALLTLFAGTMLLFVSCDTLLAGYFAWEAMGLLSFLLIAHSGTTEARRAARQAFWTTRVTDFGLLFAILILLTVFQWPTLSSINVTQYVQQAASGGGDAMHVLYFTYSWLGTAALLVVLAVIGKAAQWPLSFWLADAMLAPTPVSALLHAATMVAAGPYLLSMLHNLLVPRMIVLGDDPHYFAPMAALCLLVLIGGLSALLAGLMAYHADEPKRVLAYSTVSQLGLCIAGFGLLAEQASYFQLLAHAWSKAALFLAVGALIAAWSAARTDGRHAPLLRELAGSAAGSGVLRWTLLLGAASLGGLPLLGGALGKEQILYAAFTRSSTDPGYGVPLGSAFGALAVGWGIAALLLVASSVVTAAYFTRLAGILCRPAPAGAVSPAAGWGTNIGMAVLLAAVGAVGLSLLYFAYYRKLMFSDETAWQWMPEGAASYAAMAGSLLLAVIGAVLAWRSGVAVDHSKPPQRRLLASWFAHGMFLREFWYSVIALPGWLAAKRAQLFERDFLDALVEGTGQSGRLLARAARWTDEHIVDGMRYWFCEFWWLIRRAHRAWLQTGYVQHYMLIILLGAVLLCFVVLGPLAKQFGSIMRRF